MTILRYLDATGAPCIRVWHNAEWPKGAVELDRLPGPFEDFIDGAWVYDAQGHANHRAGPQHIAEAHRQKRWEATLIKMGLTPPPELSLLPGEAADRGISLDEMADLVAAKASAFVAAEVARQAPEIAKGRRA